MPVLQEYRCHAAAASYRKIRRQIVALDGIAEGQVQVGDAETRCEWMIPAERKCTAAEP